MKSLLKAFLLRMKASPEFRCTLAGVCLYAIYCGFSERNRYLNSLFDTQTQSIATKVADGSMLTLFPVLLIALAVFVSCFLGTEYADGSLRNKIISGHSRLCVYFSALFVCSLAGLGMLLAGMLANILTCLMQGGVFVIPAHITLYYAFSACCVTVSAVSLFVFLAMCNDKKPVNTAITILLVFLMYYLSEKTDQLLSHGSIWLAGYELSLPDSIRSILECFHHFLPFGQAYEHINVAMNDLFYSSQPFALHWEWPIFSVAFSFLITITGLLCFSKKDLK